TKSGGFARSIRFPEPDAGVVARRDAIVAGLRPLVGPATIASRRATTPASGSGKRMDMAWASGILEVS
ncbi:MAG: hypothetical protein EOO66_20500, partial [Methylobacterium sp.]